MSLSGSRQKRESEYSRYTLKLFSGPAMGAEITLGAGEYVVGRDSSNDLILNDRTVAGRHLEISIGDEGIFIRPLAHPVFVDGQEIVGKARRLDPFKVVTLGTTHFALGPTVEAWPVIGLPKITAIVSSVAEDEAEKQQSGWRQKLDHFKLLMRQHPWLKGLAIGWTLLFLLVVLASVGGTNAEEGRSVTPPELQSLLTELGLADELTVVGGRQGEPVGIQGYLNNEEDRVRLETVLAKRGLDVPVVTWNPGGLADSAQSILLAYGIQHVTVWPDKSTKSGELVMSGYIDSLPRWKEVLGVLVSDIPGIKKINDRAVDLIDDRTKALRALLSEKGLGKRLRVIVNNGTLSVEGTLLTEDDRRRWASLVEEYKMLFVDQPTLTETEAAPRKKLYIPIRSISLGDIAYLVTQDGKKYMVGSHLGKGYVIENIFADRIVLRKDNKLIEYPLEG